MGITFIPLKVLVTLAWYMKGIKFDIKYNQSFMELNHMVCAITYWKKAVKCHAMLRTKGGEIYLEVLSASLSVEEVWLSQSATSKQSDAWMPWGVKSTQLQSVEYRHKNCFICPRFIWRIQKCSVKITFWEFTTNCNCNYNTGNYS